MQRRIGVGLAVLAALAAGGVALTAGEPAEKKAGPERSTYTDVTYDFTIDAPRFPKAPKGMNVIPVMLTSPPENMFSSNVNVMIQPVSMSREEYETITAAQFKAMGLKLNATRKLEVSGRDAVLWDYEGKMQGRELRWLALAVMGKDKVYLITCTGLKEGFEKYEKEFRACIDSFRLTAGPEKAPE